jgi:hypothetical protein
MDVNSSQSNRIETRQKRTGTSRNADNIRTPELVETPVEEV